MPLNPGQVVHHRYRVARLLDQGGMGAIYRAWDTRLDIPVAIKEMVPQPGLDPVTLANLRQQFEQEAKVLARLKHLHLVSVTNFFEEEGNTYLVMEFVEGENLAEFINREGAVSEAQALIWAEQLLDALTYCHAQGIIHRDIKPQNVVIRPEGDVVLVDFGLVKLWDPNDPQTRTVMRGLGTPEYAPPEQYSARLGHTDPRSDVYSLGATLYHALTGQAPLSATDRMADPEHFAPLRSLKPDVTEATASAVMKALEMARTQRWQSIDEMRRALPPAPPASAQEPVHPALSGRGGTVKLEEPAAEPEVSPEPPPPIEKPRSEPAPEPLPAHEIPHPVEKVEEIVTPSPPLEAAGEERAAPAKPARPQKRIPTKVLWVVPVLIAVAAGIWLLLGSNILSPPGSPLFVSNRDGKPEIYRLTSDGETQRVTISPGDTGSWSPVDTGGDLLFTSNRDGKMEIYRLTSEGDTERVTRTPGESGSWEPAVGHSGAILFTSNRDGEPDIYRLTVGGETERVTTSPSGDESRQPSVATDGSVLFTSDRDGKLEIYRLTVRGEIERVTRTPGGGESWEPTVAPDGAILFTSTRDGKREIYRLKVNGETERVTFTGGEGESWAPTYRGGTLLFTSNRDGKREVYRLKGDGTTERVTFTSRNRESWVGPDS